MGELAGRGDAPDLPFDLLHYHGGELLISLSNEQYDEEGSEGAVR